MKTNNIKLFTHKSYIYLHTHWCGWFLWVNKACSSPTTVVQADIHLTLFTTISNFTTKIMIKWDIEKAKWSESSFVFLSPPLPPQTHYAFWEQIITGTQISFLYLLKCLYFCANMWGFLYFQLILGKSMHQIDEWMRAIYTCTWSHCSVLLYNFLYHYSSCVDIR